MSIPANKMILEAYCRNHTRILAFGEKLSEAQLSWQAAPETLSIAFFLWHLGRWADHLQAAVPGMTPELSRLLPPGRQVWEANGTALRWGFVARETGYAETGMEMDEAAAARLKFPPKEILLDYVRQAFAAADRAVQAIDETQFLMDEQPQPMTDGVWEPGNTVGSAVMGHLVHDCRHLGMMECLLGLQSGAGSATV